MVNVTKETKTELITLNIDGNEVSVPKGTTILNAAAKLGIRIPTLCHDSRIKPYGSCRVCLVEVEGARGPVTACSAEVATDMKVVTDSDEIKELRKLSIELLLSNHWADCIAPCTLACPAKTDAQGYVALIRQKKYREAVKIVKETNPFPATIGRVCIRPCEDVCRRNLVDKNISICFLKRFIGDLDLNDPRGRFVPQKQKPTGKKVAIIGAGPSGLSAAYYLAVAGHSVTIFEAASKVGGMFRFMPSYRLPKDVLEKEVSVLYDLGVEIKFNQKVGGDISLNELDSNYDAIYAAIGAQAGTTMGIVGEDLENVLSGIELLRKVGFDEPIDLSGNVVVIGGGNVAIDAARTAVRHGASVTLVYRRSRKEMPAHDLEIEEAEKEGVKLELLVNPSAILGNGKVKEVECVRMELGEPDESGRKRPVPVKGSEFKIKADYVISAIGQKIVLSGFDILKATKRGIIEIDKYSQQTNISKIFAGGDAVTGPKSAIQAIAAGRRAAHAIDNFVKGRPIDLPPEMPFSATKEGITSKDLGDEPERKQQAMPVLNVSKRKDFSEVELGFGERQANLEAERCLQCGCVKQDECDLRELATEYGAKQYTFGGEMQHHQIDNRHPMVSQDMNKCILCAKCVRICDQVTGAEALTLIDRGFNSKVGTEFDKPLQDTTCVSCGQCISTCPTASFVEKRERFDRLHFERNTRMVTTVCPYCGVGCKLTFRIKEDGVIQDVYFKSREGLNAGNLCVKGRFGYKFIQHPDRLETPLIKENGKFRRASWREVLKLIAQKIIETKEKHGADSIAVLSSARCTNEENYLVQKLTRAVIGTNNIDHCARLCHASTVTGLAKVFGSGAMTNNIDDIDKADVSIIIGSNTTDTHPIIGYKIRKAARKGKTKLIVVDPRRIPLAEVAAHHLAQYPGTDVAIINGIAKIIIDEGLADEAFINQRTEGFEEYKKSLNDYTADKVSKISGIDEESLKKAALLFGKAERGSIIYSMGITQHTSGTDNVMAIANLAMLTGNIGRAGTGVNPLRGQNNVQGSCDMGALPNVFSGYQNVCDEASRQKMEKAWGTDNLPDQMGLTVTEIIDAAGKGDIKFLYIIGENPALSDPDSNHVSEALDKTEFLVVQDIFLSETAEKADIVLPAASFAEKEGTFTNTERRIQLLNKVIDPIGKSKPDWKIITELSERLGYEMLYDSPADIMKEIAAVTPQYGGVNYNRLRNGGLQWPCPAEDHPGTPVLHAEQFTRGKGLFQAVDYNPPAEVPNKEYPVILTTGRILQQYHTRTMTGRVEGIEELAREPFVEINEADAKRLKIKDGDKVSITSRRGNIKLKAKVTPDIKEGIVFVPFHFAKAAANVLANKALDPIAKIPEFKVCAVNIKK